MTLPLPTLEYAYEVIRGLSLEYGVVSSPSAPGGNAVTDTTKSWQTDVFRYRIVRIIKGVGAGQTGTVRANSKDSLIIHGNWLQPIGPGATYVILSTDIEQLLLDMFFAGGAGVSFAPIEVAAEHNVAVVAATNFFADNLVPTHTPCLFRLTAGFNAAGILSVVVTRDGNAQVQQFNGGVALNNNSLYMFDHLVHLGDVINYRYSVNATLQTLRVQEIELGTQ